jgi:hypothetical protein
MANRRTSSHSHSGSSANTVEYLKEEILKEHSKRQAAKIANWIGNDKRRFKKLMELFLQGDYRVTQRSAWIVGECVDRFPFLIAPWLGAMIGRMQEPDVHGAVKRNVVRILQFVEIPPSLLGTVVSLCFKYLGSADEAIAVKALSMTVLLNASKKEPDLRNELKSLIEHMMPNAPPAIIARARKVLKQLQ